MALHWSPCFICKMNCIKSPLIVLLKIEKFGVRVTEPPVPVFDQPSSLFFTSSGRLNAYRIWNHSKGLSESSIPHLTPLPLPQARQKRPFLPPQPDPNPGIRAHGMASWHLPSFPLGLQDFNSKEIPALRESTNLGERKEWFPSKYLEYADLGSSLWSF